jgi:hypothetical protein
MSPKMVLRVEGAGSLYWLGLRDNDGPYLDGSKTYKLSIPQPVPQKLCGGIAAMGQLPKAGTAAGSRHLLALP